MKIYPHFKIEKIFGLFLFLLTINACQPSPKSATKFTSTWTEGIQRTWLGPEYWANRLQDWEISDGKINCLISHFNRNVNLLTHQIGDQEGEFEMSVVLGLLNDTIATSDKNWVGFRIAAIGQFNDYRDDAIYGKGIDAGITTSGDLFIGELPVKLNGNAKTLISHLNNGLKLQVSLELSEELYTVKLQALDLKTKEILLEIEKQNIPNENLSGSFALVSHFAEIEGNRNIPSCWFTDWEISGSKIRNYPERTFGPILFSQYTLSRGILKLTAQMPPVGSKDGQTVTLNILDETGKNWKEIAEAPIDNMSRTATFRIENWDNTKDQPYQLSYMLYMGKDKLKEFTREGTIRKEPLDKEEIVVAGFTGNNDLGFPNTDLFEAVKHHNPDLLFFSGDQIYEGVAGFGVQRSPVDKAALDYLRKWYLYGWAYGDLMRDRPSISIPDDHDVYHGNIWGAGGKATPEGFVGSDAQDQGGYKMPAEWVKMVERTQTSHLPDPYDPTTVDQGMGVYYSEMNYGGISFAIIEDRKFKSAPKLLLPDANIHNGWAQNTSWNAAKQGDVPGAILLGERQLKFLEDWAADWSNLTWMKVVLSQTIFANVATLPKSEHHDRIVPRLRILPEGEYPPDDRPVSDMDSNGWPQTGRNKALKAMRKAFALHIAGDQHLGSTIQYGVDDWYDAGFAFCVPAISNVWPRRWFPEEPGKNREPGSPKYTGDFLDGFGNKITVHAVSNPVFTGKKPSNLYDRATGYGIVRFNKTTRDITIECWPRFTDPADPSAGQYTRWPVKINQMENYNRKAVAYLPEIVVEGMVNPVIRVIEEATNEMVYTLRITGNTFRPKVFSEGKYTLKIGDPDLEKEKVFEGVQSISKESEEKFEVTF